MIKNDKYDEALELSQSMDPGTRNERKQPDVKKELSKSQSVSNRHFDEELEVSQSSDEASMDSRMHPAKGKLSELSSAPAKAKTASAGDAKSASSAATKPSTTTSTTASKPTPSAMPKRQEESSDEEDDDKEDDAPDFIEGQYNPEDYANLTVGSDIRDLFTYITRFKPQEVDLDTALKCFIPDYIPAIGEIDPFLKVPRPDGQPDNLGLKCLDEPASAQSDPTVLELQLRAVSKKQQYGDVVVRSIENAGKNTAAIDKWIHNINELHRSKPPPTVHYKRNMPDIEQLMEVWPPEFEELLKTAPLPSPDLDLSLAEYAKVLCALLDIPTYDNPIESLHLMFSLYIDFKNNPHFQAQNNVNFDPTSGGYGDADVMHINQGLK